MELNGRAWCLALMVALGGTLACGAPATVSTGPDDAAIDSVWVGLMRGDVARAREGMQAIEDPVFKERAQRDIERLQRGRAAALVSALDDGSWLAARYDASNERALSRLASTGLVAEAATAVWLESAQRSVETKRGLSAARAALGRTPGGAEAAAFEIETLLRTGKRAEATRRLRAMDFETARLRLARRRLHALTGRLRLAVTGLLDDIEADLAVPASLRLLDDLLATVPMADLEQRATALMTAHEFGNDWMGRVGLRVAAALALRSGDTQVAEQMLARLVAPTAEEWRLLARLSARAGGPALTPEAAIDVDSERDQSTPLRQLRVIREWGLVARESYQRFVEQGESTELEDLLATLDASTLGLAGRAELSQVPHHDYGVLGRLLDSEALDDAWEGQFLLGGQALGLTAEIALWDVDERREMPLPERPEAGAHYIEYRVRNPRVPGFLASQGADFQGVGLDKVVFLDLDRIEAGEFWTTSLSGPELAPLPAAGASERRDLLEPLDVAQRLRSAAHAHYGDDYRRAVVDTVSLHERKHILDGRDFLAKGVGGKLVALFSAGLLPSAVRSQLERRAQLHALRHAEDPRIALAQCIAFLPVEGARRHSEHAVGYAILVKEFLTVLDEGEWEGAVPLAGLGLQGDASLLQQLHHLEPETIRAIAQAIDD